MTVRYMGACRYMNRLGARCRIQEMRAILGAMPLDFSGQDLEGADLGSANLKGRDLRGAKLSFADLRGADLSDAVRRPGISRADMEGATGLDTVKGLVD